MDQALRAATSIGVILGIIFGGRLLLRPLFRWIARSRTPEIFTAASLLLVVGIAGLMQLAGLSMALGAFLAGVLLAESEYRRELETDIEPFKGLLLGLFFIAVGMSIDFDVLLARAGCRWRRWCLVSCWSRQQVIYVAGLAAMKPAVPGPPGIHPAAGARRANSRSWCFRRRPGSQGVFTPQTASLLIGAVAVSMLLSRRCCWWQWTGCCCLGMPTATRPHWKKSPNTQNAPVIVAGFGRYGQIVGSHAVLAQGIAVHRAGP
jgi:glutathione-regulated potassium-efflux system ancillary protein KefC